MQHCAKVIFSVLFVLIMHQNSQAQHYFFVEAEGGQAFYMKIYDTLYSSTGEGFLIIPKVTDNKVIFTIGFPKGLYPEMQFELTDMDRDRGFLLKQTAKNQWLLLDRQTQDFYQGKGNQNNTLLDTSAVAKKNGLSNDFANMLAEVTVDKTLVTEPSSAVKTKTDVKEPVVALTTKKDTISVVSQIVSSVQVESFKPLLVKSFEARSNNELELIYEDRLAKDKTDTIKVSIDFPVNTPAVEIPKKTPINNMQSENPSPSEVSCVLPVATTKDIRGIQKKILGLDTEEEQLDHIEKIYKSRCFTVDQTKEIGWFFREESVRLKLFKRILPLLKDKTNVSDLGVAFFKEENVRAFKTLISQ